MFQERGSAVSGMQSQSKQQTGSIGSGPHQRFVYKIQNFLTSSLSKRVFSSLKEFTGNPNPHYGHDPSTTVQHYYFDS